jgi:cell division inhibitor SulA
MRQQVGSWWQHSRQQTAGQLNWPEYFQQKEEHGVAAVCQTLQHLNQQSLQGWVLVIAPPFGLSKQLLEQCQVDCQRVLLINARQVHHYDNLMRDALTCSTCSAVVSFLPDDNEALDDYQYLANKYQTLLINHNSAGAVQQH